MSQLDINYHSRSSSTSSLYLDNDYRDQEGLSTTPPNNVSAKRYATYELNWRDDHSDYNSIDDISEVNNNNVIDLSQNNDTSMNSAQAARWSLPKSQPPTIPLPPVPQDQQRRDQHKPSNSRRRSKKAISINTTKRPEPRDNNESEPQSPFGGITVTTVKVVEIHSPTEKDENKSNKQKDFEPLNLSAAKPVGIITSERKRKNRLSYLPPPALTPQPPPPLPHNHKEKLRMNQDPKMIKQQNKRISIMNSQKINSSKRKSTKPEMIIPKEMAFIDARLLAHKSLVRTPTMKLMTTTTTTTTTNRNRRVKRGNKRRMPPKNFELGSTSNPMYSNDPTDMEADLPIIKNHVFPWLPDSHKPPQLIHASLVPLPHRVNGQIDNPTNKSNNITNNVNDVSHSSSVNLKRNLKILSTNYNRLTRVNSQKRRASVISQNPNRASLVFRRQILEESLMMSFGMPMGNVGTGIHQPQPPLSPSKLPIRRKTKKVSNAKIEDREKRRERRRKEKLEKKLAEDAQNNASNNNNTNDKVEEMNIEKENGGDKKPSKVLEMNRIIESRIEKDVIYMGPQPPPRKQSQDATLDDHSSSQKSKNNNSNSNNNTLPLFASPPERRIELPGPLTDEPPPFPAHLARSTLLFEHNSSKEISKRKQPMYPPPSVSNHSRLMPSPLEENELVDEEETQYDIINSDEAGSIQQLPPSNKSQKTGMGILGFFNKQATKDSTSPPLSQISSPVSHPTQLPPQSPKKPVSLSLSSTRAPPSTNGSPQSPPLSPSRALRIPQQLLRSRRGAENVPSSPPAVSNPEKLRKMEQFEALIAGTETSNSSKKPITEKIKALTTAITTAATTATSSSSSSITTSNTSFEKSKKSTDGTSFNSPRPSYHSPRPSSESNLGLHKPGGEEREQRNRDSLNSSSSLVNSLVDSINYRPEEMLVGKPGDDGVIRMTLTPAVCR